MDYKYQRKTLLGEKRIEESEYRLTKPRRLILSVLNKTAEHLSAEDIYQEVFRIYPAIGLTTVYRTLEMFVKIGLVCKFDFGEGKARYELNIGPEVKGQHHHHLICTNCHSIKDYIDFIEEEAELIKKTEKGLEALYNFKINSHVIEFYGLCEKCKKARKERI